MKERDEQIEMIVERMMREGGLQNQDEVKRLQDRLKILKAEQEKLDEDRKIELSIYKQKLVEEQELNGKLEKQKAECQKRLLEYEGENEDLRLRVSKLQSRIKSLDEDVSTEKLRAEALKKSLEAELDLERGKTKKMMDDVVDKEISLKKQYEYELKDRDERHLRELDQIEDKVRKVVEKKDGEIKVLREELNVKDSLCDKYEELLERQRRNLTYGLG